MHRRILITMLSAVALIASAANAAVPIGKAIQVEGDANVTHEGGSPEPLISNGAVYLRDLIATAEKSCAEVEFDDGTHFYVGENSEMLIDEYVYSPEDKKKNVTKIELIKGAFRMFTGKITELNPDRFKVKSRYGTIGIRGTELGFRIGNRDGQVFFISVNPEKPVTLDLVDANKLPAGAGKMVVGEDGWVVAMVPGKGFDKRRLLPDDLRRLIFETTPLPPALRKQLSTRGPSGRARAPSASNEDSASSKGIESIDELNRQVGDVKQDAAVLSANMTPAPVVAPPAPPVEMARVEERAPARPGNAGNEPEPEPEPESVEEPPAPVYPIVGPKVTLLSDNGSGGWSWDIWSRSTTDLVEESPETTTAYGASTRGRKLTSGEFQALDDPLTGRLLVLNGSGPAGAVVAMDGSDALMQGTFNISSLVLGKGVLPSWDGDISVSGGGNSLDFSVVAGGISLSDGSMSGNASSYSLQAFGKSLSSGSLTKQSIDGRLVGPGTGTEPVTGAAVEFEFQHGGEGITVVGAGGADL